MNEMVQLGFDYGVLSPEQAQRTQEAEYRIIGRTQKTIAENGRDLVAVKRDIGHGHFLNWIRSLGISESTAQNLMAVAENFGEIPNGWAFENRAMYLLSTSKVPESAREEAKERADSGEKITEEIARQIRDAHKAKGQAEEKAESAQQELFQLRTESHGVIVQLSKQIEDLQSQITTISKPEIEIREVKVTPPEVTNQVETLQAKVKKLTEQRDNLAKKAETLGEQARQAVLKRNEEEKEQRIRLGWRKTMKDFQVTITSLLTQMPTPNEVEVFEAEDWERLSRSKELTRRFIAECDLLSSRSSMIVDAR